MRRISFLLLVLVWCISAKAQSISWQKLLGGTSDDVASAIQQTADGGYIVAGESDSNDGIVTGNHGDGDIWVVKLNNLGNVAWQKTLGGSSLEQFFSIHQTTDGGYIVAGYTGSNDGDVTGNHGGYDAWVVKLDAAGNISWQKALGGSANDAAYDIKQTAEGGYIVAGYTYSADGNVSSNNGNEDAWVVKLDANGNISWEKALGGSSYEFAQSIQQTTDGGYIMAGHSSLNNFDIWIVKLDAGGNISWQNTYGGSNHDAVNSIQQTTDGGYIMAAFTKSNDGDVSGNHGGFDIWIIKLDDSGNISWQKTLGGSNDEAAYTIRQTTDGGYIVSGDTNSNDGDVTGSYGSDDAWVLKLNSTGSISWQKVLGGSDDDVAYAISQTIDGHYIVAGYTYSTDGDVNGNNGEADFWVLKLADNALPASFGSINAIIENGDLRLSWVTLSETNNAYFEIEVSSDGEHFKKIGTVKTLASYGNSNEKIAYSFAAKGASLFGLTIALLLCMPFSGKKERRATAVLVLLVVCCGIAACNKNNGKVLVDDDATFYIRIAQVDQDGNTSYSEVVKPIKR